MHIDATLIVILQLVKRKQIPYNKPFLPFLRRVICPQPLVAYEPLQANSKSSIIMHPSEPRASRNQDNIVTPGFYSREAREASESGYTRETIRYRTIICLDSWWDETISGVSRYKSYVVGQVKIDRAGE